MPALKLVQSETETGPTVATASVSVIVPVYNESGKVNEVVNRLLPLDCVSEVLVIDDGSSDGGVSAAADPSGDRLRVFRHEQNRGKGAAIRTGLANCRGDIVVIQDADLEYAPEEIPRLVEPLLRLEADVVYGTRFGLGDRQQTPRERYLANWLLTWLSNRFTGLSLTDMETGHKAFRRESIDEMKLCEDRFGFEPELTARLAKLGCRIAELPVSYTPRSYAEGKKIGVRDGLRALWCIVRYRYWN
ncbi:Undecaprenyl-phosphate 4-deoxy-4-formamido-L-arabinose transferase [Posidoniimonas corsicana]|uniref:Undecaprenyl-phosphate 4-deoxy-4-formamido-L-arabinose transferase n=1 Tax=Posidoniimonas corsicana TaxID=1938618 RepID=A0A5C5VEU5_9BACT|nr:glycosyltransferase family 2 protein [Posidoniimonas corsicana]TWT37158.1 Undecaprenyl-phosphate 4-deoxy-4-formamido-L-arabinose transferase [Posidoniimonas corsicana]